MADSPSPLELVEELRAAQRRQWQQGDRTPAEALLQAHPDLQSDPSFALHLVYQEVLLREECGETPELAEYQRRFPQWAAQIEPLFEVHRALEAMSCPDAAEEDTLHNAPAVLAPPAIPGFVDLTEIGRGGMGVVYRARHPALGRTVALKLLLTGAQASLEARARFRAEVRAAARLQHPHVVQIHEVGEHEGQLFCALEYVEGGSLAQKLAGAPLAPREAARLAQILAEAVAYAHERGILHRDLKPANILLTPAGEPKITDFGLAKPMDGTSLDLSAGSATQTGEILGSPSYMAPEQAEGRIGVIGPATDVYALGAILYEMLTGRPPFRGVSVLETLLLVRGQEPVPPTRLQPQVPRDLETICLKCLAKEPARRYAQARDLYADLGRFLAGEPICARPLGPLERLWRWANRNRALAAAILVIVASLVTVSAVSSTAYYFEKQALRQAEYRLAENYLNQGLQSLEQGDGNRGLLFLARALSVLPANAPDLERAIRINLGGWSRPLHPIHAILPHPDELYALAVDPTGRLVATASKDGAVRIWQVQDGAVLQALQDRGPEVSALAFSPDGQRLLWGNADGLARIWDIRKGECVGPDLVHRSDVWGVAFSPDGRLAATASKGGRARIWDVATGIQLACLAHKAAVSRVLFSPDGRTLLTTSDDHTARLWDVASGSERLRLDRHKEEVIPAAFSPDGKRLATGSNDNTVCLWESATGKLLGVLTHHGRVHDLAFRPDGQQLVTGSADKTAQVWDVNTATPVGPPLRHQDWVYGVSFSHNGQFLLTASFDGTAQVWHASSLEPVGTPLRHANRIVAAAFTRDDRQVITASSDGTAVIWQLTGTQPRGATLASGPPIYALARSADGSRLLVGRDQGGAEIWDLRTQTRLGGILDHPREVVAGAFSADGRHLVTGSWDRNARVWDLQTGTLAKTLEFPHHVDAVAMTPDGTTLVLAGKTTEVRIVDRASGQERMSPLRLPDWVHALALSPDGQMLVTGCKNKEVQRWELATGKKVGPPMLHQGAVDCLAFDPRGRRLATGSNDRTARLWDAATGEPIGAALPHQNRVTSVCFSSDGRMLLTASVDKTARLWDVATGKPLGPPLQHPDLVWSAQFSHDGQTILTGADDGVLRAWELPGLMSGTPRQIADRLAVWTGMELDATDTIHILDAEAWAQRQSHAQRDPELVTQFPLEKQR